MTLLQGNTRTSLEKINQNFPIDIDSAEVTLNRLSVIEEYEFWLEHNKFLDQPSAQYKNTSDGSNELILHHVDLHERSGEVTEADILSLVAGYIKNLGLGCGFSSECQAMVA